MARASSVKHPADTPQPGWRRALHSRWFPYLVVLPLGVAVIVLVAVFALDDDGPASEGIDPRDFPVEWSIRSLMTPAPGEVPDGLEQFPAGHGFIAALASSPIARFDPWEDYFYEDDLLGVLGWVEPDDQVVSIQIYPSQDEAAAREAFTALTGADASELVRVTTADPAAQNVRSFEVLPDPAIGDQSFAYRLRHGSDDRRSEVGTREEIIPGFDVDVTAIWARVGGVILVGARNERPGINVPSGDTIDLEALVRAAAERVAAFNPETDILPELLTPDPE